MNDIQHTLLARALIDACGGVDACCKPATRVGQSQLYSYREFGSGAFMPADVIDALESRCKIPVYSQFLLSQVQAEPQTACVVQEAADVDEAGNDVWRFLRKAAADGQPLTENTRREVERLLQRLDRETAELRAVLHQGAGT